MYVCRLKYVSPPACLFFPVSAGASVALQNNMSILLDYGVEKLNQISKLKSQADR